MPVMLLRSLDGATGHANGTRMSEGSPGMLLMLKNCDWQPCTCGQESAHSSHLSDPL